MPGRDRHAPGSRERRFRRAEMHDLTIDRTNRPVITPWNVTPRCEQADDDAFRRPRGVRSVSRPWADDMRTPGGQPGGGYPALQIRERRPLVKQLRQAPRHNRARILCSCVAVALTALLPACGADSSPPDSGNSTGAAGSADSQLLAYSRCMRSQGVPNFPDPSGDAKFPDAQQLEISDSQYQTAMNLCRHLLPAGAGRRYSPAEVRQLLSGMREFSRCMRSDGVPNWPDPTVDSQGQPVFDISGHGISRGERHSPRIELKMAQCQHLMPSWLAGGPPLN
jgi:hypothetical protein